MEEIRKGLCERVVMCDLAPVFCCSAAFNLGVMVGWPGGGLYWLLVVLLPGYAYFRYRPSCW